MSTRELPNGAWLAQSSFVGSAQGYILKIK